MLVAEKIMPEELNVRSSARHGVTSALRVDHPATNGRVPVTRTPETIQQL